MEKWITVKDIGKQPTFIVPMVNPQGVIKDVRVSPWVTSSLVQVGKDRKDRLAMTLREGLTEEGWAFLADLFAEDGLSVAWERYREWMLSSQLAGRSVASPGDVKPWPAKYLPSGVVDRRNGVAPHQIEAEEITIPELDNRPAHTSKRKARAAGLEI